MSEAEELLTTPAEWDLPPERHRHFKDVLMQQIDQDRNLSVKTPGRPPRGAGSPAPPSWCPSPPRPWRVPCS